MKSSSDGRTYTFSSRAAWNVLFLELCEVSRKLSFFCGEESLMLERLRIWRRPDLLELSLSAWLLDLL
eukprot:4018168-Prorocentrum_lima.AAC.1